MAPKLGVKLPEIASLDTQLWGHFGQVKIFPNGLKSLGQLGCGPHFSVMIEAGNPKIFARPSPYYNKLS